MGKRKRKFSDEWYEHGRNPFPHLKEYWYQQYIKLHPHKFGFTHLEGPFDIGPDFKGWLGNRQVTIEVEKEYLSYRQHGHQGIDVLIVGTLERPHRKMVGFLPPVIKNLDPQEVMDWSEPMRRAYREKIEKRERESLPRELAWVQENQEFIEAYRIKNGRVEYVSKESAQCECGGVMFEIKQSLYDSEEMTEGQMADYMAGFGRTFQCKECGMTDVLDGIQVATFD